MLSWIAWYLLVSLAGWLAFPLAYRLLPTLPDRGYAFSRTLGLLLWGYIFWLLTTLGLLRNEVGGILFALLGLIGLSLILLRGKNLSDYWNELYTWAGQQRGMILMIEGLFLLAFAAWSLVRATNPEALGTEKPMELAFINAILRSPTFPPHDPWLSGYGISYYYFGYVLVGLLAKLSATPGGVAFNLGLALVFALSALGAYGMVYNLLALSLRQPGHDRSARQPGNTGSVCTGALLGPLFTLFVSNAEGFLHALHSRGLFWTLDQNKQYVSSFWSWLDMNELSQPPAAPFTWVPDQFWWWWRASRVITDYDLANHSREIIDEFPFFSYLLADLHPHVLSMPFVFLGMALALNIFLGGAAGQLATRRLKVNRLVLVWGAILGLLFGVTLAWIGVRDLSLRGTILGLGLTLLGAWGVLQFANQIAEYGAAILTRRDLGQVEGSFSLEIDGASFLLAAVTAGGMAFLNTWDFPVAVALFAAAATLYRSLHQGWSHQRIQEFLRLGLALGLGGGLLYLPFYLGFASQAGGILPNLIYPTRGAHLWVMFGTLLLPLFAFLGYLLFSGEAGGDRMKRLQTFGGGVGWTAAAFAAALVITLLFGFAISAVPEIGGIYLGSLAANNYAEAFQQALTRRLANCGGWLTLLVLLAAVVGLLRQTLQSRQPTAEAEPAQPQAWQQSSLFAVLLILFGALLVVGPEFFFLRDQFGWRMNTIFKFYYQAWLLWSVAAAFGAAFLLRELRAGWNTLFSLLLAGVIGIGLVYPIFSLWNKTNGFGARQNWTLDSSAYFASQAPEENEAVTWLRQAAPGVVAEAVSPTGGSYSEYARVATLSGLPGVLGWTGHESQWRGGSVEMGSRQSDLQRLYCTRDWTEAQEILQRYQIRYIFVGSLERATYVSTTGSCPFGVVETKFMRALTPVFQSSNVTIYEFIPKP